LLTQLPEVGAHWSCIGTVFVGGTVGWNVGGRFVVGTVGLNIDGWVVGGTVGWNVGEWAVGGTVGLNVGGRVVGGTVGLNIGGFLWRPVGLRFLLNFGFLFFGFGVTGHLAGLR
jgi:hypothetical protein